SDSPTANIVNNGTLTLPSSSTSAVGLTGFGTSTTGFVPLVNKGTMQITGSGGLFIKGAATLLNASSGTLDLQSTGGINDFGVLFQQGFNSGSILANQGLVKKEMDTGTAIITSAFNNSANVDVEAGSLVI